MFANPGLLNFSSVLVWTNMNHLSFYINTCVPINYRLVNWSVVPQANLSIIRVSGLVINSREKKRLFMTLSVYCQCKEILP